MLLTRDASTNGRIVKRAKNSVMYVTPQGNQPTSEVTLRAIPCPSHGVTGYFSMANWGNYLSNVAQSFITTNTLFPYLAEKGVGALTSGAMSEALYGTLAQARLVGLPAGSLPFKSIH